MSIFRSIRNLLALGDVVASRGYNLEDPNTPLGSALGAIAETASGVSVSASSAMRVSAVLACVRIIAEGVGSIPLHVYKRVGSGKLREREHPTYQLLHDRPNPYMSAIVWKELAAKQVLLKGNHYSEIQFDRWGYPVALWPLNPESTWPEIGADGALRYKTAHKGDGRILSADQVLHIKGLTEDGIEGVSVISYGRETIGVAAAADRLSGSFYSKGANPSGVLTSQKALGKDGRARLAEAWRQAYSGLDNSFRVVVLEDGLTWTKTTIDPVDAQLIESKKYSRSEIYGIFRVPPHLAGDTEKATSWGTGIEEQNIGFVTFTLMPWMVRIEQECNFKLFTARERPTFFAEFLADAFLRGSMKNRAEALHIMRQDGVVNANEWRALENMNPTEDGSGDIYLVNGNMIRPQDAAAPKASRSIGIMAEDAFARIAARAGKDLRQAAGKIKTPQESADAVRKILSGHWTASVLMPIARAAEVALKAAPGSHVRVVERFIENFAERCSAAAVDAETSAAALEENREQYASEFVSRLEKELTR